jgi:hypothetical protein
MKITFREIALGLFLLVLFSGVIIWFAIMQPSSPLLIVVALFTLVIGVVSTLRKLITERKNQESGLAAEDEFTIAARVQAGSQAFQTSMYLWLLIFILNSYFTKHETMLGIGILGSAAIYGAYLWYYTRTGDWHA